MRYSRTEAEDQHAIRIGRLLHAQDFNLPIIVRLNGALAIEGLFCGVTMRAHGLTPPRSYAVCIWLLIEETQLQLDCQDIMDIGPALPLEPDEGPPQKSINARTLDSTQPKQLVSAESLILDDSPVDQIS